ENLRGDPETVLPHARALLQIEPHDESAWAGLIALLSATGRRREAREQGILAQQVLKQAGISLRGALPRVLRELAHGPNGAEASAASPMGPTHRSSGNRGSEIASATLAAPEVEASRGPIERTHSTGDRGKPTIVVVPFKCIGRDVDHEILADGITDEL